MDNNTEHDSSDEKKRLSHQDEVDQSSSSTEKHSFDPKNLKKEFEELIQKKFGGQVQVLSMEPDFGSSENINEEEAVDSDFSQDLESFQYKPKQIKEYLDRFVIGQDEAKRALSIAVCDHYNQLRAEVQGLCHLDHYQKQNVLLLGPTGVGKTYLVKLISELIGVPFVKADATRFSEVGYMGANVDDVIRDLVQKAGGDKKRAERGIVYIDEADKMASRKDQMGRDVSGRGVQFGFLRLLEDSDVDLNSSHDIASQFKTLMSFQRKGKAEKEIINTRNILFIFSGAFHGLEEIISRRKNAKTIGVHSERSSNHSYFLQEAETEDFINFGFEHEFVGRLPVRVSCEPLSAEDLYQVLTQSEHSLVKQYQQSFANYGIEVKFSQAALRLMAEKAFEHKTGARALSVVFEELLRPFKFELPSTGLTSFEVNEETIRNPKGYLHHLLSR